MSEPHAATAPCPTLTWITLAKTAEAPVAEAEAAGFDCRQADCLPDGRFTTDRFHADVLVVDFGPERFREDLLRYASLVFRANALVAIGPDGTDHAISALEAGADDYLPVRSLPRELFARIRAVLRGRARAAVQAETRNAIGGWTFDTVARTLISGDGGVLKLNDTEACLVRIFLAEPNAVLTAETIAARLTALRAVSFGQASIPVLINGLRRRLGAEQGRLRTVRGLGFVLRV